MGLLIDQPRRPKKVNKTFMVAKHCDEVNGPGL